MKIAVDIGNSKTNFFDGKNYCSFKTDKKVSSATLKQQIEELFDLSKVDVFIASSVVPEVTEVWKEIINNIYFLDSSHKLFETTYPKPEEIGADVVAASIAAKIYYGYPTVVMDFGTATNFNVIDQNGVFVGGVIVPGFMEAIKTLVKDASLLEDIELKFPETAIGYTTEGALQSGAILGEAYKMDGLLYQIEEELGTDVKVISTGGMFNLITDHLIHKCIYDKNLIFKGLFEAYKQR